MNIVIAILLFSLLLLLLLSVFFSLCETSFYSMNKIRIKSMASDGNKRAKLVIKLADQNDKVLSTVLIGNNLVNIAASSIATMLFVGWIGNMGVTVSTIVMTTLILTVGDITPKTIAKESPEKIALFSAPLLNVFIIIFTPINALFSYWKVWILKIFRIKSADKVTEQELLTYVEEVRQSGSINEAEEGMIRSAIEFDDLQVIEVCTPRVDIEAVAIDDTTSKIASVFKETGYSRLPVYKNTIDNIIGVILEKDFHYIVENEKRPLASIVRHIHHCPKTMKISELLKELQRRKSHITVVLDEFGGTLGIVTVEDILEELVGEIWDEYDEIESEVIQICDNVYRLDGGTGLNKLYELFNIPNDDTSNVTVGGWVVEKLGRIPRSGERVIIDTLNVTVIQVHRNRVNEVLIEQILPTADDEIMEPSYD